MCDAQRNGSSIANGTTPKALHANVHTHKHSFGRTHSYTHSHCCNVESYQKVWFFNAINAHIALIVFSVIEFYLKMI